VPEVVLEEFLRGSQTRPGDARLRPDWLQVLALSTVPSTTLVKQLDRGETAVMTLAFEQLISLIVIDERRGRILARALGLQVTGSIGILLRAKREGLLSAIRPCIDTMHENGIWLSQRLRAAALHEAGEDA
jgi:uncharacterized protein